MKKIIVLIPLFFIIAGFYLPTNWNQFEEPTFSIRFDDCWETFMEVYPLIEREQIPVTLFCTENLIGQSGYLTKAQLDNLDKNIIDIQFHGIEHKPIFTNEQLNASSVYTVIAYPYGIGNPFLKKIDNFNCGLTYTIPPSSIYKNTPKYFLPCYEVHERLDIQRIVKQTIDRNAWTIFCFHKIDEDKPYSVSKEKFYEFVDTLKGKNIQPIAKQCARI